MAVTLHRVVQPNVRAVRNFMLIGTGRAAFAFTRWLSAAMITLGLLLLCLTSFPGTELVERASKAAGQIGRSRRMVFKRN